MSPVVPHSRPAVGEEEAEAARRVIASGRLAQGEEVAAFESEVAAYLGRRHGVAVSSGTAALQLALAALALPDGARVAMPSYVCTALLHAARATGSRPLVVDIQRDNRNLDPVDLAGRITADCAAVILPHMFGHAAAVEATAALGRPVVEDCAMAIGASAHGNRLGSRGRVAVCSFYATKMMTAGGEGGMLLTDEASIAERARGLREYDGLDGGSRRYNYKMTDAAAAVGRVQLQRLDGFVARRRALAKRYDEAFAALPVDRPAGHDGAAWFRYVVRCRVPAAGLLPGLEAAGVAARLPVPQPLHRLTGTGAGRCPETDRACRFDLSVPLFPSLAESEVDQVLRVVGDILKENG